MNKAIIEFARLGISSEARSLNFETSPCDFATLAGILRLNEAKLLAPVAHPLSDLWPYLSTVTFGCLSDLFIDIDLPFNQQQRHGLKDVVPNSSCIDTPVEERIELAQKLIDIAKMVRATAIVRQVSAFGTRETTVGRPGENPREVRLLFNNF